MMVDGGEEGQHKADRRFGAYTDLVTSRFSRSVPVSSLALPYAIWRASPVDH